MKSSRITCSTLRGKKDGRVRGRRNGGIRHFKTLRGAVGDIDTACTGVRAAARRVQGSRAPRAAAAPPRPRRRPRPRGEARQTPRQEQPGEMAIVLAVTLDHWGGGDCVRGCTTLQEGRSLHFLFPARSFTLIDAFSSFPSARSLAISFFFDLFTVVFLLITSVMRCAAIFSWGFTLLTEKPEENMRASG